MCVCVCVTQAVAALYNGLSPALAGQLTASPSALSRIILQHIIPGVYPASTLRNGTVSDTHTHICGRKHAATRVTDMSAQDSITQHMTTHR